MFTGDRGLRAEDRPRAVSQSREHTVWGGAPQMVSSAAQDRAAPVFTAKAEGREVVKRHIPGRHGVHATLTAPDLGPIP